MPAPAPVSSRVPGGFSEATSAWFRAAFAEPTPAQALAWTAIGNGETTLVIAPTGSGKTLAAFLWAIDKLAGAGAPADPRQRCRVLYISPLKALAVDIERNLRSPLTGIGHTAHRLGLTAPDIRVRGTHRRHLSRRAPQAVSQAAGHPDHDSGVAVPAADIQGPRGPSRCRDRHPG
jgi:ATP-dependent Lhr-like helicase